ncbi:hypothetical protein CPB86DRAFT_782428 [Serendipita vermifera]|nr:hypothetical protein CPB86DRAFT_782428 [Serendipita vermifera]
MSLLNAAKSHSRAAPHAPRLMLALQEWLTYADLNDIAQTIQIRPSEPLESLYNVSDTLFQHTHLLRHNTVLPVPGNQIEQPQVPTLETGIINSVSLPSLPSLPGVMEPDQPINFVDLPIQTATGHTSLPTAPSLIISPFDLERIVNSTNGDLITPSFSNDPFVTDVPLLANASTSQGYYSPSGKALELLKKFCQEAEKKLSRYAQRLTEDSLVSTQPAIQERSMPLSPSEFPKDRMNDLSQLLTQVELKEPLAVKDLETFLLKYSGNTLDALGRVAGALLGSLRSGKIFYVEDDVTASSVIPSIFSNGYIIKCRSVGPGSGKREYLPGFCGKQKCNPCGNQKWRPLQDVFECIVKELLPNKSCGFVRSAITDAIKARKICEHTKTTSTFTLGRLPRNQVPRAPGNAPLYLTTV